MCHHRYIKFTKCGCVNMFLVLCDQNNDILKIVWCPKYDVKVREEVGYCSRHGGPKERDEWQPKEDDHLWHSAVSRQGVKSFLLSFHEHSVITHPRERFQLLAATSRHPDPGKGEPPFNSSSHIDLGERMDQIRHSLPHQSLGQLQELDTQIELSSPHPNSEDYAVSQTNLATTRQQHTQHHLFTSEPLPANHTAHASAKPLHNFIQTPLSPVPDNLPTTHAHPNPTSHTFTPPPFIGVSVTTLNPYETFQRNTSTSYSPAPAPHPLSPSPALSQSSPRRGGRYATERNGEDFLPYNPTTRAFGRSGGREKRS
ncbi:hypothetical protein EJ04DRAFT_598262 [Polyplosphaeria fusca]|uniref:Uncharacterized protein n=1 Tax=Polyplosphaeria fusca TaxID=682080 RepID=A0A9P4QYH6_9PLEO|nr:hypothetical protein EJ04DRAFT_598262 [Polyplosphaeria fusca]